MIFKIVLFDVNCFYLEIKFLSIFVLNLFLEVYICLIIFGGDFVGFFVGSFLY